MSAPGPTFGTTEPKDAAPSRGLAGAFPAGEFPIKTLAIVGVGLIGGSIGLALKKRGFRGPIIGVGRSAERLAAARDAGVIGEFATEANAAARADLIIFCTPVDRIAEGVVQLASHCLAGALITDAGSVKGSICRELHGRMPDGVTFIGSHPLAGSEKQGFEHADADLFEDRVCVVTPVGGEPVEQIERVAQLWRAVGMRVVEMSPQEHDRALAETSHLPHVVAAALAATLQESNRPLAASGFADTTRIAAGDPALWTPILLANSTAVAESLRRYSKLLEEFQAALSRGDEQSLGELLAAARERRNSLEPLLASGNRHHEDQQKHQ